ncbi:formate dehydrogenase subunit gamma [Salinarimonas ramus]|uniref:Formate dehydrogenase n=1 Tax=Salinarimonas ramus TaxID=690164 RepID=A0A917V661_9HYPH|nr:formate dehydrogenase subunit gamma [Salinarimonas ramus]GGK45148.1 formate dehydrogenase [Salinarimonas ramus]
MFRASLTSIARAGRVALAAIALLGLAAIAVPDETLAQGTNPTAQAVTEEQLLQALQPGGEIAGRVSIPDQKATGLIKPGGQDWRAFHQGTMFWVTIVALVGMLAIVVAFYAVRGKITIDSGLSGLKILRFNAFERFVHWLTAGSFLVLALTGINLVLGRFVLIPLFGPEAFATVTQLGKYAHNYLAWPFMAGLVFMLLVWIKDNIPDRTDVAWLKAGGGLLKKGVHPEAKKFNAGQKGIFWSVIVGGAALSVTGVLLLFPYLAGGYADWQLVQMIHGVVAAILVAVMVGHIYIGSVGMQGAFDAMGSGEVDYNWAREHHSLWAEEARRKQGAQGGASGGARPSPQPAE